MFRSQQSSDWRRKDDNAMTPERSFRASPGQSRNESPSNGSKNNRLFVGNLPYEAQKEHVLELFKNHGLEVEQISMSTDPFTGRNPSYCFVDLKESADFDRAMRDLPGQLVLDRPVKVNHANGKNLSSNSAASPSPRIKTYTSGSPRNGQPLRSEGISPSGGRPLGDRPYDRRSNENDPKKRWEETEPGSRLYVGGLPRMEPQAAATAEIEKLFAGFHIDVVSKMISPSAPMDGSSNENHYYCFVDFASPEQAAAAKEAKNGIDVPWGGQLRVNYAKSKTGPKLEREQFKQARPVATEWRRKAAPVMEED